MLEDVPSRAPEAAPLPVERLGGALAVIYWAAIAILAIPIIGLGGIAVTVGRTGLAVMLGQALGGPRHVLVAMLPLLAMIVWAAAFVTMTTVRSRSAPTIASVLFTLWGLTTIVSQIGIQMLVVPDGASVATLGPLLPSFAATVVIVAAFWGYMREGERPRRWFVGA